MKKLLLYIALTLFAFGSFAQNTPNEISGRIIDSTNSEELIGVAIGIKGSTNAVFTDADGNFKLKTYSPFPITFIVSYVGYKQKEYVLESATSDLVIPLSVQTQETDEVVVTSRRREEVVQDIPIPISVIGGKRAEEAGAFNVNRVKELLPSVQLYSSNPRNTTLNIRGLGSTFGLTNDGIDPGVGFYVDGVYYARPAATALDFVDVERIEVLRGPQGTLFGKNTTAGAFNVVSRAPSFKPGANLEMSYGNFNYVQAKASVTGPLGKYFAARLSFSGTQRDGTIYNVYSNKYINDLNNQGVRGQLLFRPSGRIKVTLAGDYNTQRPEGYAQVVAGVVKTERPAYRQFDAIIKDLNYSLPSTNPYDRVVDQNTTWKSNNDLGGASLNADFKIGPGTLTSTTAWRFWHWGPSNDRDFTALSALAKSQATSKHEQWSQEIRYAGQFTEKISGVAGLYYINQSIWSSPYYVEESGKDQWRFSQSSTSANWKTPGLLDGYGNKTYSTVNSTSAAVFAQVDWEILKGLHLLPGLRYNYDEKRLSFARETYGGLQTNNAALIAIKNGVYSNQAFKASTDNTNLTGNLTLAYKAFDKLNGYATYSTSYKPIGVNPAGIPNGADGKPDLSVVTIRPEYVNHFEFGLKSSPTQNSTANITFFNTDIKDYQTNVQSPQLGVNRGYLANAERVNVRGVEFDGTLRVGNHLSFHGAVAYTEGKYVKFENAPLPLEETGKTVNGQQVAFKDVSGGDLPGISKWAGSLSGEATTKSTKFIGNEGKFFLAVDGYARSSFSSSPTPSKYLNVQEYALLNGRLGFRATNGLSVFIWGRNILKKDYIEQLLPAAGNAGHYSAVLGDPQTYGITLRYSF